MVQEVGVGRRERVGVSGRWRPVHARVGSGPGVQVCTRQRTRTCASWRHIRSSTMMRVVDCKVGKQVVDPHRRWDTVFFVLVAPEDTGEPGSELRPRVALVQELYKVSVQVSKECFVVTAGGIEP